MPESGLRVRMDTELHRDFMEACRARDQTASQVLRAYMRNYVERYQESRQGSLIAEPHK